MALPEPWSGEAQWRGFLDLLDDAVVVLDLRARVVLANTSALRLLPCEIGHDIDEYGAALGAAAVAWLRHAAAAPVAAGEPPVVQLAQLGNGRTARLEWRRLDRRHGALRLTPAEPPPAAQGAPLPIEALRQTIGFLWDSPFPTLVQAADGSVVDANPAFLAFTGFARDQVVGRDPLAGSADAVPSGGAGASVIEGHLTDASQRERAYRLVRRDLVDGAGQLLQVGVLQDVTAERIAGERAERSLQELDDWFHLTPVGMVLFDERGLLLRTNPAFDELVGAMPATLADATPELRELLGTGAGTVTGVGAALADLLPESAPLQRQGRVAPKPLGRPPVTDRWLHASVRCYRAAGGQRRFMAVVQDRSADEERELAQLQIGALMDTAGFGLASFQEASGWVMPTTTVARPAGGSSGGSSGVSAALQGIGRQLVAAESIADFEQLQAALREARRAEVRYAIDHPELGRRWLLTRVEPAVLVSGKRTTSVVTLDITDQHENKRRTEQLLHELDTILQSTTAGIASLRNGLFVRCNQRFEAMLDLPAGSVAGQSVAALLAGRKGLGRIVAEAASSLALGMPFETEFEAEFERPVAADAAAPARWYSLSVRRPDGLSDPTEAIAMLTDVTRLKAQQKEVEMLARDRELMFSVSGVGIAFVVDGRVRQANAALAELTGRPVAELKDLPLVELFADADDFASRWPAEEANLREHGHWRGERPMRRADGHLLHVEVSKRLVNAREPADGIIASYVNVDARFRAERSVAQQAARTRSILDSVLVGIVNVGEHGIEWMNRSARRMFGGDLAEFNRLPIATVATDEPDHPFRRTHYLAGGVDGLADTFECRIKARDGRVFWVVGNVVSTVGESTGRQLTYALLDIGRRRDAEAREALAREQLQRIIEAAPLAISLRDAATLEIVQINARAAASLSRAPTELIGRTLDELYDPAVAAERRADMRHALASVDVTARDYTVVEQGESRIWDARYLPLASQPGAVPDQLLMVATDVTEQRAAQEARLEAAIAQRDMLVKEVHHRIKNNLQGVAGLLQQIAQRKPEVAGAIAEVVGQVQAIAQVYGLQVGASGPLRITGVTEAIAVSVQRTFGRTIAFTASGETAPRWLLPEAESIPIALTLNELLTNALKHSAAVPERAVECHVHCTADAVEVEIANPGRLPAAFELARIPGGVSGLGLVRALLPRRSATLVFAQRGDVVSVTVTLKPPGVTLVDTEADTAAKPAAAT